MNTSITAEQLRRAADIQDKIDGLKVEFSGIFSADVPEPAPVKRKYKMSAKARKAIGAAQRARWAKVKAGK